MGGGASARNLRANASRMRINYHRRDIGITDGRERRKKTTGTYIILEDLEMEEETKYSPPPPPHSSHAIARDTIRDVVLCMGESRVDGRQLHPRSRSVLVWAGCLRQLCLT